MKTSTLVGVLILILLVAGGSFYAGTLYHPQMAANPPAPTETTTPKPTPLFMSGTVVSKSSQQLILKMQDGTNKTISISSSTPITLAPQPISLSDLKAGDAIGVIELINADGTVNVQTLIKNPPMAPVAPTTSPVQ